MTDEPRLPIGYRQGLITSITVVLTASLLFFRFVVFESASGTWTKWGVGCAVLSAIATLLQLFTLWRALQPEDEQIAVYNVTLRWFASGVVLLLASFAANAVANLVY